MKGDADEFACDAKLDRLAEVRHWVRNLAGRGREKVSLWLQTSTDRFYPDFVAALVDGRTLAVEYKGDSYRTNDDSKEKDKLGRLWADRSGGRAVFVMVETMRAGMSVREQLLHAIREQVRGLR